MSDGNTTCPAADKCDVCGRCTMCHPCDPRYDHGDPLPAGNVGVNLYGPGWYSTDQVRDMLNEVGVDMEHAEHLMAQAAETMDCYVQSFLHQPDEYHATRYPDGVLHTFAGPNHDGHTHTWHVTTRHPEGTNHEQL